MKKTDSSRPGNDRTSPEDALKRAAAICSKQEKSSGQIREKLHLWNVDEEKIDSIIEKLSEEGFLDDARFAQFYSRDKFKFNGWGKIKIGHMLRSLGVDQVHIEEALEKLDDDVYFDRCLKLLKEKSSRLKDSNAYSRKGKLFRFASGRGYESELIYRALDMLE